MKKSKYSKVQRILALIAIIVLVLMYVITLFFAIFDNSETMTMLKGSLACTIFFPVMIWVINMFMGINRHQRERDQWMEENSDRDSDIQRVIGQKSC